MSLRAYDCKFLYDDLAYIIGRQILTINYNDAQVILGRDEFMRANSPFIFFLLFSSILILERWNQLSTKIFKYFQLKKTKLFLRFSWLQAGSSFFRKRSETVALHWSLNTTEVSLGFPWARDRSIPFPLFRPVGRTGRKGRKEIASLRRYYANGSTISERAEYSTRGMI